MMSNCNQLTLVPFSGRLRRVGDKARKTEKAKHNTKQHDTQDVCILLEGIIGAAKPQRGAQEARGGLY